MTYKNGTSTDLQFYHNETYIVQSIPEERGQNAEFEKHRTSENDNSTYNTTMNLNDQPRLIIWVEWDYWRFEFQNRSHYNQEYNDNLNSYIVGETETNFTVTSTHFRHKDGDGNYINTGQIIFPFTPITRPMLSFLKKSIRTTIIIIHY